MLDVLEPIGDRGAYIRAGVIAATVINMHQKPGSTTITEGDIFPWLEGDEDDEVDPDEIAARMAAMFPNVKKG